MTSVQSSLQDKLTGTKAPTYIISTLLGQHYTSVESIVLFGVGWVWGSWEAVPCQSAVTRVGCCHCPASSYTTLYLFLALKYWLRPETTILYSLHRTASIHESVKHNSKWKWVGTGQKSRKKGVRCHYGARLLLTYLHRKCCFVVVSWFDCFKKSAKLKYNYDVSNYAETRTDSETAVKPITEQCLDPVQQLSLNTYSQTTKQWI